MKIKFCGLRREQDILYANELKPDYIGFVFAGTSKRYVDPETALLLRNKLADDIIPVGVFVDKPADTVADMVRRGIIDVVQLHGKEDEAYIAALRELTDAVIIQAFRIGSEEDAERAGKSSADYILLDSGQGTGSTFNWSLISGIRRDYFLAGGLNPGNVSEAVRRCNPFAVDVSSGIETDGFKDIEKMRAFTEAVKGGSND